MILLFDRFVCRKASINMTASCSSALMLWYVHRQPQRTRQTDKADALFEAYKDASDDSIGPEGQNLVPDHQSLACMHVGCIMTRPSFMWVSLVEHV